jgi:hypothetical protein
MNVTLFCIELEGEQRRHADVQKIIHGADRRIRELTFQQDENKKHASRLTDLVDKLQQKLKVAKRQVEEAVCALHFFTFTNRLKNIYRKNWPRATCKSFISYRLPYNRPKSAPRQPRRTWARFAVRAGQ